MSNKVNNQANQTNQAQALPQWDGLYIKTTDNQYKLMQPLLSGSSSVMRSTFTGEKYLSFNVNKNQINFVPLNIFKGFYFKGAGLISNIKVVRILKGFSFTQLFSKNDINFAVKAEEAKRNLFAGFMCQSTQDSVYCEVPNQQGFMNYLKSYTQYDNNGCILIKSGEEESKGGKVYILCFQ